MPHFYWACISPWRRCPWWLVAHHHIKVCQPRGGSSIYRETNLSGSSQSLTKSLKVFLNGSPGRNIRTFVNDQWCALESQCGLERKIIVEDHCFPDLEKNTVSLALNNVELFRIGQKGPGSCGSGSEHVRRKPLGTFVCVHVYWFWIFLVYIYIDARESEQLIYISVAIIAYSLCQPPPPPPLLGTFRVFQLGRHAVHNGQ
jgi:hypothetical protein